MAAPPPPPPPCCCAGLVVVLLLALSASALPHGPAPRGQVDSLRASAMERLLRVFGLPHHRLGRRERHAAPPQYMVDLYNTIADQRSGVTRHDNPYHADVVRSFPDADSSQHHLHFFFNVLDLEPEEQLLEAEFHVYKLKPRPMPKMKIRSRDSRSHLLEMRVYQVMNLSHAYQEDGNRLLDARRISAYSTGWEVFHVREAVTSWLANNASNYGLLVSLRTLSGETANESKLRVVKRRHHNGRQPILVLFTSDGRKKPAQIHDNELNPNGIPLDTREKAASESHVPLASLSTEIAPANIRFRSMRRRRAEDDPPSPSTEEAPSNSSSNSNSSSSTPTPAAPTSNECSRHELYVDFERIGWAGWIISPKGYDAHYCSGTCSFPLGQNHRPTNHATVQSIVHELGLNVGINSPCCVPNKLLSINLLYYDDHDNVIFKRYDEMVAESCGCH